MSAPTGPRPTVDLNSDVGESFGRWVLGDDEGVLDAVTSANVACGFHAGDPTTLRRTVAAAVQRGVVVGAQVGYRDLVGFGRRFLDVSPQDLSADVLYQVGALEALCRAEGTSVRYLKPHGALYNAVVHHRAQAEAVVAAVVAYDAALPVLGLPGSVFLEVADAAGLRTVAEFFADRGYVGGIGPDRGTLVDRRADGALLHDPDEVAARVLRAVQEGLVAAVDGTDVEVSPASVCVHGDSPGAVAMAAAVRERLVRAGVAVEPFA